MEGRPTVALTKVHEIPKNSDALNIAGRTSVMKKLGVGVLGFSTHQYNDPFASDPRSKLVAAAEETTFTQKFKSVGVPFIRRYDLDLHKSYEEVIERGDVDIVTINTEPYLKADLVEKAAAAGKHIICDKPMAHTLEAARRMVKAVEKAGVTFMVRYGTEYSAFNRKMKETISKGEIGQIVYVYEEIIRKVDIKDEKGNYYDEYFIKWVTDKERSGGGELINFGCYALDFLRYIGESEVTSVYAHCHNAFFDLHRERNVEDFAHLTLRYGNGMSAHVIAGRVPVCKDSNKLRILGTGGTILSVNSGEIVKDCYGKKEITSVSGGDPNSDMISDFLDCVFEGRQPRSSFREGEKDMEVLEAAYRSAEDNEVVEI